MLRVIYPPMVWLQIVKEVPWFTDRILTDITLGSLIVIMLYRLAYFNLTSLQVR